MISTDFIKQRSRRDEFALLCPELVIVDEAHTCIAPSAIGSSQAHQRYMLLRKLADDQTRHLLLLDRDASQRRRRRLAVTVGLLDPRLGELPSDLSGRDREDDRKLLARFMIQRQRADIREYLSEDTPFPARETAEESYKLTPEYRKLFDDVMSYAREQVTDPSLNHVHRRVRWWSAIALLRCLASSPAAAEQTLLNRSDAQGRREHRGRSTQRPSPGSLTPTSMTPPKGKTPPSARTPQMIRAPTPRRDVACAPSPPRRPHSAA